MPTLSGVYIIVNTVNGKVYVGSSRNIRKRWRNHLLELDRTTHGNEHLQRAWTQYGREAFDFEVLEYCIDVDLIEREDWWIGLLGSLNPERGYNIARATRSGVPLAQETRDKMSAVRKVSPAVKQHLQKVHLGNVGRVPSDEHRVKISLALRGHIFSEDRRLALSQAHKNSQASRESIERARSNRWNRTRTLAKPRSKEHQDKLNASVRARCAKHYIVTSPDGTEYQVFGLSEFCRKHGLDKSNMSRIATARSKLKSYKGWTCRYEEPK